MFKYCYYALVLLRPKESPSEIFTTLYFWMVKIPSFLAVKKDVSIANAHSQPCFSLATQ